MTIVIAGGGTGGHVFPGLAVAQYLKKIDESQEVVFVGTKKGLEYKIVPKAGFRLETIAVSGLKGRAISKKIKTLLTLPLAVARAFLLLRKVKASVVLGVGGYASAPIVMAAVLRGLPIALCEQNSVPGLTNKILGHFSQIIFGSFSHTASFFPKKKFVLAGNPLREGFETPKKLCDPQAMASILVLGGSQGARALNQNVPHALAILRKKGVFVDITHQTGDLDLEETKGLYESLSLKAKILPFIDDMLAAYSRSDIAICRAGATTCAEISALGLPSILVPFPFAIYDHQTINAQQLAKGGSAILLAQSDATPENLATKLETVVLDRQKLSKMANAALSLGRRDAASKVASALLSMCNKKKFASGDKGIL